MKVLSVIAAVFAHSAAAQDVGIEFWDMAPGTRWVTATIETPVVQREETYLGQEGAFYVTEYYQISAAGKRRFIFKNFYDAKGRRVRGERDGMAVTYKPFQCRYAVGPCSHESSIPYAYAPDNEKFLTKTRSYVNRLEGRTFYLEWVGGSGTKINFPFELGRYNLRVSQAYENAAGEKRGFTLVEIVEP